MAYCTAAQVQAVVSPVFFDRALLDTADQTQETQFALLAAVVDNEINGYLTRGGFELPLDSTPAIIADCAIKLCSSMMAQRRGVKYDDNPWGFDAKTARETLELIATGALSVGIDGDTEKEPLVSDPDDDLNFEEDDQNGLL